MKIQMYWSEITHYTNEVEIPFDDFDSKECQEYIRKMAVVYDGKEKAVGTEIERNSVDIFEVS